MEEYDPTATDPDEPKESQQEPQQDSQLQTPQPDQPAPTEQERREEEPRKDDSDSEPRPLEDEQASGPEQALPTPSPFPAEGDQVEKE